MTSTPVTVGNGSFFTVPQPAAVSKRGETETSSFSDLLKNQGNSISSTSQTSPEKQSAKPVAGDSRDTVSEKTAKEAVRNEEARKTDSVQAKDSENPADEIEKVEKTVSEGDTEETAIEEDPTEQAEKALEEMGTQLVMMIADRLEVTPEEVVDALKALDMEPADLMDTDNLKAVLLQASGEADAYAMATDENLYNAFAELSGEVTETLETISQETGISTDELKQMISESEGKSTEISEEKNDENITVEQSTQITESAADTKPAVLSGTQENASGHSEEESDGRELERQASDVTVKGTVQNVTENTESESVESTHYFDRNTMEIMDQITDYMKGQVFEGGSEVEMQLHPATLGTLHIHIAEKDGQMTAQFTASSEQVKAVLEGQMIELQETFKEQGITVTEIEVTVQTNASHQDMNGGEGQQSQETGKRASARGIRRINLNDLSEEDMTEDEKLAAELLRQNGTTVDYMA